MIFFFFVKVYDRKYIFKILLLSLLIADQKKKKVPGLFPIYYRREYQLGAKIFVHKKHNSSRELGKYKKIPNLTLDRGSLTTSLSSYTWAESYCDSADIICCCIHMMIFLHTLFPHSC